jgi:protoporphyrinogen/coproporphyrinogen III oxidase
MSARRVVVVGGGISGLAVAHALVDAPNIAVTLLEARSRLGGNIVTHEHAGFVLDGGPDSWVNAKPAAGALAKTLGLEREVIGTKAEGRKVYVALRGVLHPMPEGLVLGVPTKLAPMAKTPIFSWDAKLRAALEPLIPARTEDTDVSIGDFFARRLGEEVTDRLIAPMLGGIYAGDAFELSMRATFPQFMEAERKYGSLIRAMLAQKKARGDNGASGRTESAFSSLRGGLQQLPLALAQRIENRCKVRLHARVDRVAPEGSTWNVHTTSGEMFSAEHVVFAGPAYIAANALREVDRSLSDALARIRYVSTATVFLAFRDEDVPIPLDAVGFIVPRGERRELLASTWVSSKWSGRAPEGHALIRVFFGGAGREAVLEQSDADLAALAAREIEATMGFAPRPIFSHVFRFDRSSPQPLVGHIDRVARIRGLLAEWPGLHLIGSGFAIGIPDCVKLAQETAKAIAG